MTYNPHVLTHFKDMNSDCKWGSKGCDRPCILIVNLSIFCIIYSQTNLAKQVTRHNTHTYSKNTFKQQQNPHKNYIS
jgi:hypothetical protein